MIMQYDKRFEKYACTMLFVITSKIKNMYHPELSSVMGETPTTFANLTLISAAA